MLSNQSTPNKDLSIMRYKLILLSIIASFSAANAQFSIKKIIKPSDQECNGKIVLEFEESELPATLAVVSQSNGGVSTIDTKMYTLSNLCPDTYTITMTDNHKCVTEDEVVLGECDLDVSYIVTRENCYTDNGFKIDLENLPDGTLFFKWSKENQPIYGNETSSLSNIAHGDPNRFVLL